MRTQLVVVAIVQDDQGRFLVTHNAKWGGYAFPMHAIAADATPLGSQALHAVADDLGTQLPHATVTELDYLEREAVSFRTGEETQYSYWLYTVQLGQALPVPADPKHPPLFLTLDELTTRSDITWSTASMVSEFVLHQDSVLALVTRAGEHETEVLLVWHHNYGGYFFPSTRVKTEVDYANIARGLMRRNFGYCGPVSARHLGTVHDQHYSDRFGRTREYRFQVCTVRLAELDLHQPNNFLEQALARRETRCLWMPISEIAKSTVQFSPTMHNIRDRVLALVPSQVLRQPLRTSAGGLALIERTIGGQREWLAQWNEKWKAFFFVGGKREDGESFRDCVLREIAEELSIAPPDCTVAATAAHHLEYRAISRSADELTAYTLELFATQLTPTAVAKVQANPRNKWLSEREIQRLEASDGRPISVTMGVMLNMAGLL